MKLKFVLIVSALIAIYAFFVAFMPIGKNAEHNAVRKIIAGE